MLTYVYFEVLYLLMMMILAKRKNKKEEYSQQRIKIIALFPNKTPNSSYFLFLKKNFPLHHLSHSFKPPLLHLLPHILVHHLRRPCAIHPDHLPSLLKVFDDGEASFDKDLESLFDAFDVVVRSAGGFAPVEESLLQDVFGAVEEQGEGGGTDGFVEFEGLVHFAWETCCLLKGNEKKKWSAGGLERVWRDARFICFI